MFHRVKEVFPLSNYMLRVRFMDNTSRDYNVAPLFDTIPAFLSLKTIPGLFDQVRVDMRGYGIVWNSEIDLSCDELWEHGIPSS